MKKVLTYMHVATYLMLIQVAFSASFAYAQTQTPVVQPKLTQSVEQQQSEQAVREYEYLKTQSTALVEQSTKQYDKLVGLVDVAIKVAGIVGGLFVAIMAFMGWKTKKEMVEDAKSESARFAKKMEDMYAEEFDKRLKDTNIKFQDLERTVKEVEEMQRRLQGYKNSRLVIVGTQNRPDEADKVLRSIDEQDFQRPIVRYFETLPDQAMVDKEDIFVFGMGTSHVDKYNKSADGRSYGDPELVDLVGRLKQASKRLGNPIPIIVYAPQGFAVDTAMFDGYPWYVFAQMPVTLINTVYTIGYAFYKVRNI